MKMAARIFGLIVSLTIAIDSAVVAWFFLQWVWLSVTFVALLGSAMLIGRRSDSSSLRVEGWALGDAVELTNPNRPNRVSNAIIASPFLNLGFLAIGAPGSGKTVLTLAYLHSFKDHSPKSGWAYFEGKGDTDIYRKCVAVGCKPTHFFSTELPGSESINLMAGHTNDVVDRLSKVLIGTTESTSYYSDTQRAVLSKVLPLLLGLGEPVSMRDLYAVLTVEGVGHELSRRASAAGVDPVIISLAKEWFNQSIEDQIQKISGLLNRLFIFVSGAHTDRLNCYQPDIDIEEVVEKGESIYFHLPLTIYSRDVAIALVEAFGVEARKRQLGGTEHLQTYPLAFDDWGAFFHDGFGPFSARCRSAAMPLSFSFQSRAQLEHVSMTYADELDDTIATKFIMRVHGRATGEYAVSLLGEYEAADISVTDRDWNDGVTSQVRSTPRIERRQLRELQPGEAYVSTLQRVNERDTNPLWRVQIPMPPVTGWEQVPMPDAIAHHEGNGLSLWTRYMQPGQLAKIHAQTLMTSREEIKERERQAAALSRDARLQLVDNPGLVEVED
jgi:hypothetical protein